MVVQRTLNKIEELKERPHHERRAVALYIAVGVVVFLGLIWGFATVRALSKTAMRLNGSQGASVAVQEEGGVSNLNAAASAAAATGGTSAAALRGYTASSTNGKVEIVPIR